ncbi:MAG: exo-alpha-sialidase, partial [Actinobacteria bacterium]|nr:exo-alpha-sialidase [Actinomycetota bacterium]
MSARRLVRLAGVTVGVLALLGTASAPAAPPPSAVRLGYQAGDDWEPSIAADGYGHVYAFWNHYGFDPACPDCPSPHMELQISSNGGRTWSSPRPLLPDATARQDDPQIVVDPVDGRTVYAAFMMGDKSSQFVARSIDFGQTWTPVLVEPLQRGTDKDILAVRGQHVYLVYNAAMKIYASVSHDGGQTWATYPIVANTNSKLGWSLPSGGAIDSQGNAYFAWAGYEGNGKPSGDVNLFVSKSADGGVTWTTTVVDVSGAPPPCGCGGWAYWGAQMALAVDGLDRVYVLYNDSDVKFGVQRMYFRRSEAGGATWSPRREVSLAPTGANNLFPAIVARGDGDVRI